MNPLTPLAQSAGSHAVHQNSLAASDRPFSDNFSGGQLDTKKWEIATYKSPGSRPGVNAGMYVPSAIDLAQGMLRITVNQKHKDEIGSPVESLGGAIISRERFGFGTYEFEMRMSSTSPTADGDGKALTGAVSSAFLYHNKSESEIDLEFLGNENAMWVSVWRNLKPSAEPTSLDKVSEKAPDSALSSRFRRYTLVWMPDFVDAYIDGVRVAHATEHVPQTPAHIILQHRGTNNEHWGGTAEVGVERYFYVRNVTFTPLGTRHND